VNVTRKNAVWSHICVFHSLWLLLLQLLPYSQESGNLMATLCKCRECHTLVQIDSTAFDHFLSPRLIAVTTRFISVKILQCVTLISPHFALLSHISRRFLTESQCNYKPGVISRITSSDLSDTCKCFVRLWRVSVWRLNWRIFLSEQNRRIVKLSFYSHFHTCYVCSSKPGVFYHLNFYYL